MRFGLASEAYRLCVNRLSEDGVSITMTTDHAEVAQSVSSIGKPYLTPWLDPERNDFTEDNFFWLIARKEMKPVIVGGGRLDLMGPDPCKTIHRMFVRGYGEESVLAANPNLNSALQGRACYLGDLFSAASGGLGRRNVRFYLGIANYIAAHHFKADCTYSFMRGADINRGSKDTNGFDRRLKAPVVWGEIPDSRNAAERLVYRRSVDDPDYFGDLIEELEGNGSGSAAHLKRPAPKNHSELGSAEQSGAS